MKMNEIILIIDFFIPFVLTSYNQIQELQNIHDYNIVKTFTVHTVTECVLACQNVTTCDLPGTQLLTGNLLKCMLLEQKRDKKKVRSEEKDETTVSLKEIKRKGKVKKINNEFYSHGNAKDGYKNCDGTLQNAQVTVIREIGHGTILESQVKWFTKPVEGAWSSWGVTSPCNVTCGRGTLRMQRICDCPSPSNGGRSCLLTNTSLGRHTEEWKLTKCNMIPCVEWNETKLIVEETSIGQGKLIATVSVPKEFKLSFDVKVTSFIKSYNSIMFIRGVLKMWFRGVNTKGLLVRMFKMNGGGKDFYKYKAYKTGQWINVVISQIMEDEGYQFKIEVDGEVLHKVINKLPESVNDAKVVIADGYISTREGFLPGYIKGLSLVVKM